MIVQVSSFRQLMREAVNTGKRGRAGRDISRERSRIILRRVAGVVLFAILPDSLAYLRIDALPVVAPCELIDKFASVLRVGYTPNSWSRTSASVRTPGRT